MKIPKTFINFVWNLLCHVSRQQLLGNGISEIRTKFYLNHNFSQFQSLVLSLGFKMFNSSQVLLSKFGISLISTLKGTLKFRATSA